MSIRRIFVYGTLKRGFHNNHILQQGQARLVDPALVVPGYKLWESGLPYMVPTDDMSSTVTGEVWEVPAATMARLDWLEGHPEWYTRTPITDDIEAYLMLDVSGTRGHWNETGVYQRS